MCVRVRARVSLRSGCVCCDPSKFLLLHRRVLMYNNIFIYLPRGGRLDETNLRYCVCHIVSHRIMILHVGVFVSLDAKHPLHFVFRFKQTNTHTHLPICDLWSYFSLRACTLCNAFRDHSKA